MCLKHLCVCRNVSVPETPEKKRVEVEEGANITNLPKSPVYYAKSFSKLSNPIKRKVLLG